ncbi:pentatricopeptide repeat-containing protein At1g08070, chloroplastic [Neltuma alba]|uniref:pentatricopeptide repeat-containing protein At1g08070, chloroplastic n=1 Tax=Neltuma alba TaxID=207710 RepID=UPI0010A3B10A|nr:pentatricopeptide repeat-containing protein At1g08070, chloroplastic [Prosopis alba]XP_028802732.1 pentatricopeptide repeat-containing protein At1g08070, chloroplastic [Prosopis alba]XP_028802733.1 pentatricopeptide repeat-containing protein At1g08070, chloroplastic [Prosopis alba]XP_028802734.1 pentatricopeptide repeat-containing protein At1g08070, chloroplastic [Prosopis alba]XP_028802735.1 pentatricopeptide repeat-containing protein At1g08070, chloroplastic [Prosopis alba]XP_028802736.1 
MACSANASIFNTQLLADKYGSQPLKVLGGTVEIISDPSYKLLSKCKSIQTLKQIHSYAIKTGIYKTPLVQSKLIQFCAVSPFGDLPYALSLFQSIEKPNLIMWNTIIRGHWLNSSPILSIQVYARMLNFGVEPNSYTFPFLLKSCAKIRAIHEGKQVHAHILKLGFASDAYVHTSLITMYAQIGDLDDARLVFDSNIIHNVVSFTALISAYLLEGYVDDALHLFDEIPVKDVVSWNAMIAGYAQSYRFEEALSCFREMLKANVSPNQSTLVTALSSCAQSGSLEMGKWISSWIKEHGFSSNLQLTNALIDMYSKCGETNTARELFDGTVQKDVISWNVMIGGYSHMNLHKEALSLFHLMVRSNMKPNDITFLAILPACTHLGALDLGKWIHAYIDKNFKNMSNVSLQTSLINMYAKCGCIEMAEQVFKSMNYATVASWNAMISGLAMHGHAEKALRLFSKMANGESQPDDITFVGVLSACSQGGLVDLGCQYFESMVQNYKIVPKLQHYGCMIDLLAKAGKFEEAQNLIKNMEVEPDGAIWGSLLNACRVHGHTELGEYVADHLFKLEPENTGAYVLLSNIYAAAGRWDDVARIRTRLNDRGMKKVPGCTSIEIDSFVHEFLVGDRSHPESENIYEMLNEIDKRLDASGFVPNTSEVLYDMDEEWKEGALSQHSEKLAIAFGLISTKPGTTIRIVKNLRVCGNCHLATKLISKIFNREIIARDRNRFHHFKDGVCSCNDYW